MQKEKRARHTPEQKAQLNAQARKYRSRKTPEQRAARDAASYQRQKENPEFLKRRSAYKRAREADRKRMLDLLKLERGCYDCGNRSLPPEALEWDHVRGKKLFNLGGSKTRKLNAIFDEIAKCDCVCANCHRARTVARRKVY
jgi:hypothetical protein